MLPPPGLHSQYIPYVTFEKRSHVMNSHKFVVVEKSECITSFIDDLLREKQNVLQGT